MASIQRREQRWRWRWRTCRTMSRAARHMMPNSPHSLRAALQSPPIQRSIPHHLGVSQRVCFACLSSTTTSTNRYRVLRGERESVKCNDNPRVFAIYAVDQRRAPTRGTLTCIIPRREDELTVRGGSYTRYGWSFGFFRFFRFCSIDRSFSLARSDRSIWFDLVWFVWCLIDRSLREWVRDR